jgi:hypothetical protein
MKGHHYQQGRLKLLAGQGIGVVQPPPRRLPNAPRSCQWAGFPQCGGEAARRAGRHRGHVPPPKPVSASHRSNGPAFCHQSSSRRSPQMDMGSRPAQYGNRAEECHEKCLPFRGRFKKREKPRQENVILLWPRVGGPPRVGANARTRSKGHAKSKKPAGVLVFAFPDGAAPHSRGECVRAWATHARATLIVSHGHFWTCGRIRLTSWRNWARLWTVRPKKPLRRSAMSAVPCWGRAKAEDNGHGGAANTPWPGQYPDREYHHVRA